MAGLPCETDHGEKVFFMIRPLSRTTYVGYLEQAVTIEPKAHTMIQCSFQRAGLPVTEIETVLAVQGFSAHEGVHVPTTLLQVCRRGH